MQEAALYLKVHYTTVQRYIKLGKLKVHKPGGKLVRVCQEELERFAEGKDE